jgi:hypothetical protein
MGGKWSRDKGRRWELALVNDALERGIAAIRNDQYLGATEGGSDVILNCRRVGGQLVFDEGRTINIEAKCGGVRRLSVPEILRLLYIEDTDVVAVKIDRKGEFFAVRPDLFLSLLQESNRLHRILNRGSLESAGF